MGSKTERGLSCPLQSQPSFPTINTSPVATRRLTPEPTISIVGHVPTKITSWRYEFLNIMLEK